MKKVDGIKTIFTHPVNGINVFLSRDDVPYFSGEVEICVSLKNISYTKHQSMAGYYYLVKGRKSTLFDTACEAALNRDIQTKEKGLTADLVFENAGDDMPEYSSEGSTLLKEEILSQEDGTSLKKNGYTMMMEL